ncbi:hypothetical protein NHF45_09575 [Maricaulaceae bacterium NA33B04]|nr:hypothetical protein [Maricaulaceae bacterium NA33B04]
MSTAFRRLVMTVLGTGVLLLVTLVLTLTNQNSTLNGGLGGGFDWGLEDFLVMGLLLLLVGLAAQLAVRLAKSPGTRVLAVLLVVLTGFVIWAELAVGVISRLL